MAVAISTTEEQVEAAIAFLRESGREAEARGVEALLSADDPGRRRPTGEPEELVPIAEAAPLLGTSRKGVLRRIESGVLIGNTIDVDSGYVTRSSLSEFLEVGERLARIAEPMGGLEGTERNGTSQVGQMLAQGIRELEELETAEMAVEAAEAAASIQR